MNYFQNFRSFIEYCESPVYPGQCSGKNWINIFVQKISLIFVLDNSLVSNWYYFLRIKGMARFKIKLQLLRCKLHGWHNFQTYCSLFGSCSKTCQAFVPVNLFQYFFLRNNINACYPIYITKGGSLHSKWEVLNELLRL